MNDNNHFKFLGCITSMSAGSEGNFSASNARAGRISTPSGDGSEKQVNGTTTAKARSSRSGSKASSCGIDDDDVDGAKVPHRDQWLALRVQGGSRNWPKLGSCFNNSNSSV